LAQRLKVASVTKKKSVQNRSTKTPKKKKKEKDLRANEFVRNCEHLLQMMPPQRRQWCRRFKKPKERTHVKQAGTSLSGIQRTTDISKAVHKIITKNHINSDVPRIMDQ
jgi:hypothetical protein